MRQTSLAGGSFESLHQQREVLGQLAEAERIYRERLEWSRKSGPGRGGAAEAGGDPTPHVHDKSRRRLLRSKLIDRIAP